MNPLLEGFDPAAHANQIVEVVGRLRPRVFPILRGLPPVVQGASLMDLLAIWLAGHQVTGDTAATHELRTELLMGILLTLDRLVAVNTKMLGTELHEDGLLDAVIDMVIADRQLTHPPSGATDGH